MHFEEDYDIFDLNPDDSVSCQRTHHFRIDSCPTILMISEQMENDPEREARIIAHQKRVQRDLAEIGV